MSARKTKPSASATPRSVFEWLAENALALAAEITSMQFAEQPELDEKYGRRGRQKCSDDAAYHLHFLAESIAAGSPQLFTDYVRWANVMLSSRHIDPSDLAGALQRIKGLLVKRAGRARGIVIRKFMNPAIQMLPSMPSTIPSFIDREQPFAAIANEYLSALLVLDRDRAIANLMREVEGGLSIRDVFQHVIFAVQREVGRLWQLNQITVVQEHYCTAAVEILLSKLRRRFVGIQRSVSALALCAGGEEHSVGVKLLAELLEADGWYVHFIGANAPTRDVVQHLHSNPTDIVAISVATPLHLDEARTLIDSIKLSHFRKRPKILVGGAAFTARDPNLPKTLGADAFAADVIAGVETANRLVAREAS
jgi:MerR family transcriptional regulator, light-induced transcriptional regulator